VVRRGGWQSWDVRVGHEGRGGNLLESNGLFSRARFYKWNGQLVARTEPAINFWQAHFTHNSRRRSHHQRAPDDGRWCAVCGAVDGVLCATCERKPVRPFHINK